MIALAADMIEKAWYEMETLEPKQIPGLVDRLGKEQPFVLAYLMGTGSELLNKGEREALMFMGLMVWRIMQRFDDSLPVVDGDTLDKREERNIKMLEYLAGEPESEFMDTVDRIMARYHQAELLRFIIDRLMEEPEKGVDVRSDTVGMIVIYLKTVIDCLDAPDQPN